LCHHGKARLLEKTGYICSVRHSVRNTYKYYAYIFALIAGGVLFWWLFHDPVSNLTAAVPGMDKRTENEEIRESVIIGEFFESFSDPDPVPGTRWPRFRGADLDNISKENTPLINSFESGGPKILWTLELGEGHAAPAVWDGLVYILDYDEAKKADALRCFSLTTGEEMWRRWYKVHLKRNHGLSRTVPTVTDEHVITIGPRCQVMCVDRLSGEFRWGLDLEKQYGIEVPFWYTGQCPLVIHDTLILAVGGSALMIGVDVRTGNVLWETPNPNGWKMSHASVMPMTFGGKTMAVYPAVGGVCGISLSGEDVGQLLWETTAFAPSVAAPSPVILGNGKVFLTAGYGYGGAVLEVKQTSEGFSASLSRQYKPVKGLASEQQTPILHKGYLYAIMPKDGGALRNEFVCFDPADCQRVVMRSGKSERFGLGPYLLADGKFFILNDDGEMTIAKASPNGFQTLGKARIIDGQDSWGPLVITGGYLLMRDSKKLVCLDMRLRL